MRDEGRTDVVSPTEAARTEISLNKELLVGLLTSLLSRLKFRCTKPGCAAPATYEVAYGNVRKGFRPRCDAHAKGHDDRRALEGADWTAVALQLIKECKE